MKMGNNQEPRIGLYNDMQYLWKAVVVLQKQHPEGKSMLDGAKIDATSKCFSGIWALVYPTSVKDGYMWWRECDIISNFFW